MKSPIKYILCDYYAWKNRISITSYVDCFFLRKSKRIKIGKNSKIDKHTDVGIYTYIGENCRITKASIGNYCSIADNVTIGPGEHALNKISLNSCFYENPYDELTNSECQIGNDVWIGVNSIVLRGVEVGNGAVIGANSLVTKSIPPYAIAVGSPAKVIRTRFSNDVIKSIEATKWYEKEKNEAKAIISDLHKRVVK